MRRIERMRAGMTRLRSTQASSTAGYGRRFLPSHVSIPPQAAHAQDGPAQHAATDNIATVQRSSRTCDAWPCQQQHPAATRTGSAVLGHPVDMSKRSYALLIILLIPAAFLGAYLGVCALGRQVDLELPLWLRVWSSAYIAGMLHVAIMALAGAHLFDAPIERVSFGLGKRWFQ